MNVVLGITPPMARQELTARAWPRCWSAHLGLDAFRCARGLITNVVAHRLDDVGNLAESATAGPQGLQTARRALNRIHKVDDSSSEGNGTDKPG